MARLKQHVLSAAICIGILLISGCNMFALREELKVIDQNMLLHGKIISTSPHHKPVIVLLYELKPSGKELVSYSIYHKLGTFNFLQLPGRYIIAAFEDANEDLIYQRNEYAGYYGDPTIIDLEAGKDTGPLNVTLRPPDEITLAESPDLSSPSSKITLDYTKIKAGEVTGLDNPQFAMENGVTGFWEPVRFLNEIGGGVYFLEPYDSKKIPILFVHGAEGYPLIWSSIIEHLDHSRFQPWIYYYPSGMRLEIAVELLRRELSEIRVQKKKNEMVIVAHSMGGFVSRGLINKIIDNTNKEEGSKLNLVFISISTAWRGSEAAPMGVKNSPAVVPSWIDMVPGSPFQEGLFKTSLPDYISYYLLFSFKGGVNPFLGMNNDGSVSLASQLYYKAQEQAIKVYGINEDHTSILAAQETSDMINEILIKHFTP